MYYEIRTFENYLNQLQSQEGLRKVALELFIKLQDAQREREALQQRCDALKYQRKLLIQNLDAEGYQLVPFTLQKKKGE